MVVRTGLFFVFCMINDTSAIPGMEYLDSQLDFYLEQLYDSVMNEVGKKR